MKMFWHCEECRDFARYRGEYKRDTPIEIYHDRFGWFLKGQGFIGGEDDPHKGHTVIPEIDLTEVVQAWI